MADELKVITAELKRIADALERLERFLSPPTVKMPRPYNWPHPTDMAGQYGQS